MHRSTTEFFYKSGGESGGHTRTLLYDHYKRILNSLQMENVFL